MGRPPKPCIRCGKLIDTGSYCEAHTIIRKDKPGRASSTQRGYGSQWQTIRAKQIESQPSCAQCGTTEQLTADHIIPKSKGGTDSFANLQTLCARCNTAKGDRIQ